MGYALILQVEFLADLGRLEEAAEVLQMLETQVSQGRLPEFLVLNSRIMIALERGDMAAAAAPLARILELVNDPSTAAFPLQMFVLHLVPFLARHAQTDAVLQILTRAVEAGVIPPHDWLILNPRLASIRDDARFADIMTAARLQFEDLLEILDDARSREEFVGYLEAPLATLLEDLEMLPG